MKNNLNRMDWIAAFMFCIRKVQLKTALHTANLTADCNDKCKLISNGAQFLPNISVRVMKHLAGL